MLRRADSHSDGKFSAISGGERVSWHRRALPSGHFLQSRHTPTFRNVLLVAVDQRGLRPQPMIFRRFAAGKRRLRRRGMGVELMRDPCQLVWQVNQILHAPPVGSRSCHVRRKNLSHPPHEVAGVGSVICCVS